MSEHFPRLFEQRPGDFKIILKIEEAKETDAISVMRIVRMVYDGGDPTHGHRTPIGNEGKELAVFSEGRCRIKYFGNAPRKRGNEAAIVLVNSLRRLLEALQLSLRHAR